MHLGVRERCLKRVLTCVKKRSSDVVVMRLRCLGRFERDEHRNERRQNRCDMMRPSEADSPCSFGVLAASWLSY